MAISGSAVWEVRPAGSGASDTNGGAFVTGASGTDHSQQDSPAYAVTDGVTAGTTAITSATANFGTDVIGNIVYVAGGTGSVTPGWYQITARPSTTEITVDRSTGLTAGTGVTLNIGGALASPGLCASLMTVSLMRAWWKAGTYNINTSTPGAGGPVVTPSNIAMIIQGYETTRGDAATNKPTLVWNTSAPGGITPCALVQGGTNQPAILRHVAVDGAGVSNVYGIQSTSLHNLIMECTATGCSATNMRGIDSNNTLLCHASSCTFGIYGPNNGNVIAFSTATGCSTAGIFGTGGVMVGCIGYGNSGIGLSASGVLHRFINCVAHNNGTRGFQAATLYCINCVSTNNTQQGYYGSSGGTILFNCASRGNSSRGTTDSGNHLDLNPITLSDDPYVDASGLDFRPNSTEGGGALLRGTGMATLGQTSHMDVGIQALISGSAGAMLLGNLRGNFQ